MNILQKNREKITNTKQLLIDIISDPDQYNIPEIKNALSGQRKLAAFSSEEYKISACALNTFKNAADNVLLRGFIELDELRQNAKQALDKEALKISKPNHNTKEYFKERLRNVEEELDQSKRTIISLTAIIGDITAELANIATANHMTNEERQAIYKDVNNKLQHKLAFALGNE